MTNYLLFTAYYSLLLLSVHCLLLTVCYSHRMAARDFLMFPVLMPSVYFEYSHACLSLSNSGQLSTGSGSCPKPHARAQIPRHKPQARAVPQTWSQPAWRSWSSLRFSDSHRPLASTFSILRIEDMTQMVNTQASPSAATVSSK